MGSIIKNLPGQTIKGFAGKEYPVPMYLQFVPGYCADVVHSEESNGFSGEETVNSIFAVPHVTDKFYKRKQTSIGSEDSRYYPLLRSHGDVPSKGDPVLLCTIGKVNFYLGPMNTIANNPTWNKDPHYRKELSNPRGGGYGETNVAGAQVGTSGIHGETQNFNKDTLFPRLQKRRKEGLDSGPVINETIGDTILEGRHGNSLRIGSRSDNPYVFLSNKRSPTNVFETLGDGSIISITSEGTLFEHFDSYIDKDTKKPVIGFTLSSDTNRQFNNTHTIANSYLEFNNVKNSERIYEYRGNQMLLHSDRVTLNSKLDDIFISSVKDMYINSARSLSVSSGQELGLVSNSVNIGGLKEGDGMQPMVLGDALQNLLNKLIDEIKSLKVPTTFGPETPLSPTTITKVENIRNDINTILSGNHNIKGN